MDEAIIPPSGSQVGTEFGWPKWAADSLWKSHKDRTERFALFCFLFQNGVPPGLCNVYIMWHTKFGYTYDPSAIRDQEGMKNAAMKRSGKTFEAIMNKKVKTI